MREMERILLECRYLLSLNKNFSDLAIIFHVSEDIILDDYPHELFSETYSRLNRKENKE